MAYMNMSGTSDTDLTSGLNRGSDALGPDATTDALGEPEVIEVVEIETYEPTPAGAGPLDEAMATANQPGFQWWMVPAVALPVAAGATAVALLLRRRQQKSAPAATYNRLAKQSRDWLDTVRSGQTTKAATKALQQGVESVRTTALGLPDTASAWRDSAGDLLAALATSAAAKQATGGVKGALDSVTGFWNTTTPSAKQATKEQGRNAAAAAAARARILGLLASGQAQDAASAAGKSAKAQAKQAAAKANKAADKAKPVVAASAATASVKAAKAARQTNRMAKRAGKSANNAAKRTRAFTFGMLVAATATYWRAWRQRLLDKETRETAGGRLVKA